MYEMWCFKTKVLGAGADLEFDDSTDTCTMVSGTYETVYKGAD